MSGGAERGARVAANDGESDDVAPDGSPVAFYRALPPEGEPELIHALLRPDATILDLGCGTGRIAGPLAALGHPVVGVDDGAAMVAALPSGVEGIVADGTRLRLERRFGAVLLASHLVNSPADGPAFAATAAAHLRPDGVVIGQTYPPGWQPGDAVGRVREIGPGWVRLVRMDLRGDLLDAEVQYGLGDRSWVQTFTARVLDEPALRGLLAGAGLAFDRWLDLPGWFLARRAR